jgi:hypothetical protein
VTGSSGASSTQWLVGFIFTRWNTGSSAFADNDGYAWVTLKIRHHSDTGKMYDLPARNTA